MLFHKTLHNGTYATLINMLTIL